MIMKLMRQKFHLWVFWILVVVLALGLVLPGIELGGNAQSVVVVNGEGIDFDAYNRAASQTLEQERNRLGGEISTADSARIRKEALDSMVEELLALQGLKKLGLRMDEKEIRETLVSDPSFRDETGAFSQARYVQFLNAQAERGMSPADTETLIAKSLKLSKVRNFWAAAARVTPLEVEQGLKAAHRRVRAKVMVWDYKSMQAAMRPKDEELRTFYSANRQRWATKDQIKARHILIKADALTGTMAAKAKADELYTKLKAGSDFAALAKANSQDEGSAKRGGDLGFFSKGDMVPEFEAKASSLKTGELGEPVLSQFGWHIIRVEGKKPGFEPTFENSKSKALDAWSEEQARREARRLAARAAKDLQEGKALEAAAKANQAGLRETGWFKLDDASILSGLGDTSSLASNFLALEKGQDLAEPAFLEKGVVLGRLNEEQAGELIKDQAKLASRRQEVSDRLRNQKAEALYRSWLLSLKAEAKIDNRYDKFFGPQ